MGSAFFTRYQAEIVPQLWLLTRKAQSRIFQQIAVPDILKQVLTGLDVAYQLQGTYKPRDYCVQYRETDFNFASRLMEEEGIYLLLHARRRQPQDGRRRHAPEPSRRPGAATGHLRGGRGRAAQRGPRPRPGRRARRFGPASTRSGTTASSCPARTWRPSSPRSIACRSGPSATSSRSPATTSWSFTTTPAATPSGSTASPRAAATGPATSRTSSRTTRRTAGIRMQQEATRALVDHGPEHLPAVHRRAQVHARAPFQRRRGLCADPGRPFRQRWADYLHGGVRHVADLREHVRVHPAALPFRPARTTPRPTVEGTQTAVVVGNPGRGDLHGQVRPGEGPVPLGPRGQERTPTARAGSAWRPSGPASSGA